VHGGLRRGMTQNRTADSGGIQAALRELFPVIAVLDEAVRESEIDDACYCCVLSFLIIA